MLSFLDNPKGVIKRLDFLRSTPSVPKYKMFKHLFFPSVSRHVLVQGSNESYTKTYLDTEEKKKCLNILYLGTERVV